MIQSLFIYGAVIVIGVWLLIAPKALVLLIERANNATWEAPNLLAIRVIGGVSALATTCLLLKRLLLG